MEKENKVKAQYDRMAQRYDQRWLGYLESTLGFLERKLILEGHEKILDVACGTGALEKLLVARHPTFDIVGIDISEKMLVVAREKLKEYPNVIFKIGRASEIPFPAERFDFVVCASSLHYFDDPEKSLSEIYRVLIPGGKAIILDWCRDYFICRICDLLLKVLDPAYQQCYNQEELRRFLEQAGFRVLSEQRLRLQLVWGMMFAEAMK